jgi:integrase
MARRSHGGSWECFLPKGRTIYVVRFRTPSGRVTRSTGESDSRKAAQEAARIYADVISGRVATRAAVSADLEKAFAGWLAEYEMTHAAGTTETVTDYVRADLLPFFQTFDRFTAPSYSEYIRKRIKEVTRSTLRKELSALRMFCAWCVEQGVSGLPPIPSLPKAGHPGTRAPNARRRTGNALTPAEIAELLLAMPERSRRTGDFVRPFFQILWETGLRPYSTVAKLEAPLHYRRGQDTLFISREIDKSRYERRIPLTDAAREALDRVCPESGPLFPGNPDNMRDALLSALRATGIDKPFSIYDIRHSRISHLANSGAALAGVAFLVGHKHVSTTALYVHASMAAAESALEAVRKPAPKRARRA